MARYRTFDIEEAEKLFKITPSWRAVARQMGVHPDSVRFALEPLGYKSACRPGQRRTWSVKEAAKLRQRGKSIREIAKMFKRAESAIRRGLAQHAGAKGGLDAGEDM